MLLIMKDRPTLNIQRNYKNKAKDLDMPISRLGHRGQMITPPPSDGAKQPDDPVSSLNLICISGQIPDLKVSKYPQGGHMPTCQVGKYPFWWANTQRWANAHLSGQMPKEYNPNPNPKP